MSAAAAAWYLVVAITPAPTATPWNVIAGPSTIGPVTAQQCEEFRAAVHDIAGVSSQCRKAVAYVGGMPGTFGACPVFEIDAGPLTGGRP